MKWLLLLASLLVASLTLVVAVSATTVIPQTVEQLAQQSVLVVSGTATRTWTAWNPQHTEIVTYTEFAVAETLKGVPLKSVLVRQTGGSRDGMTLRVAGVGLLQPGEQAVLFLRSAEPDGSGALAITGLMQGHFHSIPNTGAMRYSNGLPAAAHRESVESYDAGSHVLTPYTGRALSLDELRSRVRLATGGDRR